MGKTQLKQWDSAEHLKTEVDMAQYLDACMQEAGSDATFLAKALGIIARAKECHSFPATPDSGATACTKLCRAKLTRLLQPY